MRSTAFYLDDRSSKERELELICVHKTSFTKCGGADRRSVFEAWLIAKKEFDHTQMTTTSDFGLEILSRDRHIRIVRPVDKGFCDILYWAIWDRNTVLTPKEVRSLDAFKRNVAEACEDMARYCRKVRGRAARTHHYTYAIKCMDKRLGVYLDTEVQALGETNRGMPPASPIVPGAL